MKNLSDNSKIDLIIWSQTRKLKWTDFKKKPNLKSRASASSAIGFESEPLIDHFEDGGKFKFKILDMGIHAIFIPSFSWVSKTCLNKDRKSLLKHEQGHFDMGEEIIRKSKIKTAAFFRKKIFKVEGKNKFIAEKNAISQVTVIRDEIEDELKKELQSEEAKYDNKTNHGLILLQQEKYDRRFQKLR